VKFLIFDMDGVLVDSTACHARAFDDLWRRYGVDGPAYATIAGRPTREVVAAYTGDVAEWTEFKQQRAREYLVSESAVFEDVLPCLEAMRRAGIGMGVATGASRITTEMLLARAGITDYFEFVLTAEDVRAGKPDPELYGTAVERSGAPRREVAVVEDAISGLEAAAAASTQVACVRAGLSIDSPFFLGSFPGLREFSAAVGVEF
jgi:HAD superfamily hydrolase (TIGR01509 family)